MLTRLIVDIYAWIIEVWLWLALLISGFTGYHTTLPLLNAAGWAIENGVALQVFGAIMFVMVSFLALAVATGPLLVLFEIRKSVRSFEQGNGSDTASRVSPAEYREPTF